MKALAFHFIGGIIDPHTTVPNAQTMIMAHNCGTKKHIGLPRASGSVIEATFPNPGIYVGVDHAMRDVLKGGAFAVVGDAKFTDR